jgi:hypothetical protein
MLCRVGNRSRRGRTGSNGFESPQRVIVSRVSILNEKKGSVLNENFHTNEFDAYSDT